MTSYVPSIGYEVPGVRVLLLVNALEQQQAL